MFLSLCCVLIVAFNCFHFSLFKIMLCPRIIQYYSLFLRCGICDNYFTITFEPCLATHFNKSFAENTIIIPKQSFLGLPPQRSPYTARIMRWHIHVRRNNFMPPLEEQKHQRIHAGWVLDILNIYVDFRSHKKLQKNKSYI